MEGRGTGYFRCIQSGSDGEYTALAMQFANDDGTYDDENMVTYLLQANEEENVLELYDPDSLEMTATLEPYEAAVMKLIITRLISRWEIPDRMLFR